MSDAITIPTRTGRAAANGAATRARLMAGALAGPLWIVVAAAQALTRDGFDLTRHPVSLLSNGELGWIQIASFVVTGLLLVLAAPALHERLTGGDGATWAPRLLGVVGIGMVASGIFVADPADGFPAGTPLGAPEQVSWHGGLHFLFAAISFVALVAAALVLARRFSRAQERGLARYSAASGGLLLVAWVGLMAAPDSGASYIAFAVAVAVMLTWTSAVYGRLARTA